MSLQVVGSVVNYLERLSHYLYATAQQKKKKEKKKVIWINPDPELGSGC